MEGKPTITADEFMAAYCERAGVTIEWLSRYEHVVPCGPELGCDYEDCKGWAMVPLDFETHNGLPKRSGRTEA